MNQFYPIQTPMPPMLKAMIRADYAAQYIALYYHLSQPCWTDGLRLAAFNYQCWQLLSDHPAIRFPLQAAIEAQDWADCEGREPGLGNGDVPTHLLMLDTVNHKMAIAPWKPGWQFLKAQHPPRSQEQIAAAREAIAALLNPIREAPQGMNQRAMISSNLPLDPEMIRQQQEMITFLNQHLDPEIQHILRSFEQR